MVAIPSLWLPILLAAILVFVASSIMHMLLKYHHNDYQKLPNESKLLAALRAEGLRPGSYSFPRPADMKDMGSPEMIEKYTEGPVGLMTVMPSGPPAMGKYLGQWFAYTILVGVYVAYLTGRTVPPGSEYLAVFRVAGATAFAAYGLGNLVNSIWKGQGWSVTAKEVGDGLVYALLTAGAFAWLWPA